MTRLYGRSSIGQRVYDKTPGSSWNTTTMLSSLRLDGSTACLSIAGTIDGLAFREYVKQILVPSLRGGDIVILDNLSVHKDQVALKLIEKAGAKVKLFPGFQPD